MRKICPKDNCEYEDFCMDYSCEDNEGVYVKKGEN